MRAIIFDKFGGPEVLKFVDVPVPELRAGDVLIKVKATSVNHLDLWIRNGLTAYGTTLPHIPGCDIAGIVEDTGEGVSTVKTGEKVFVDPGMRCFKCDFCLDGNDNLCVKFGIIGATTDGGYAEYVRVPEVNVIRMPENLSFEEAAAFPLVYLTAWHMLIGRGKLQPGEDALIIAAGSGIGSAAIQIAKLAGAKVIATAGGEEKTEKLKSLAPDYIIDHSKEDIYEKAMAITDGRGVDLVFEHVGPATFSKSLRSLKKNGRMVICGATTGAEVNLDLRYVFSRQLNIHGSIMGRRSELLKITGLMAGKKLKPVIDSVYTLENAVRAHEKMESRAHFGKIVITVD
ncbi:MAG: zinc-binding dehydrogenase [Nitrospirae bacterium]|nr:zinc-binding dehydrogenase [Nitrospirota bacterium]